MIDKFMYNLKVEINNALKSLGVELNNFEDEIILEIPKDTKNGDFSTNIAMRLARTLRKAPMMIANDIKGLIDLEKCHLEKVEVAGAGFINFYLDIDYLFANVSNILSLGSNYGNSTIGQNQKICLEYVSANPTGYLHIGHGRGAAFGDTLARVMKKAGFDVHREHYVNDAGNQINNMALSVYERYKELYGLEINFKEDYYHGKEIITIAEAIKAEYGDKYLKDFDLDFFKEYGTKYLLGNLKKDLQRFNVEFDNWFSEKSLYAQNHVQSTLEYLNTHGYTYTHEGALWLKTSTYGDEKDRVIVKSDGNYTYLLPDIAYHANKLSRGYDHLIDVLGADHHGYIDRLKAAVSMVGGNSDLIDVEILQMVRVLENGEEVKMSKRSGKAITLIDLIDEVGKDALRYFYVSKSLSTHVDLDLDLMKKTSNENPVFYAQYAHARIASIFKNFEKTNEEFAYQTSFDNVDKMSFKNILMLMANYQVVIEEVASKRLVHKLAHYLDELAYALHSFYNDQKVITEDIQATKERMTVLAAMQIIIKDCLTLMGISAPDKM